MASNTRSRSSDDSRKDLESKIQEINSNYQKQIERNQAAIEDKLLGKMDQLLTMVVGCESRIEACNASIDDKISCKLAGVLKNVNRERVVRRDGELLIDKSPILPTPSHSSPLAMIFKQRGDDKENQGKRSFAHPKVELTHFSGEDPRSWIRKCNKFFLFHQVSETLKYDLVEMYLDGKADTWFQSYKFVKGVVSWEVFCDDLVKRFGRKGGVGEQEEFNKLVQLGSLSEYIDKSEELKSVLLCKNPYLDESYFVSSFISGLRGELKPMV